MMPLTVIIILVLLVAACWWTLLPLFARSRLRRASAAGEEPAGATVHDDAAQRDVALRRDLEARVEGHLLQLKDLEFDRQMGKIDEEEFAELRRDLVRETAAIYKELDQAQARGEHTAATRRRNRDRAGPALRVLPALFLTAAAVTGGLLAVAPTRAAAEVASIAVRVVNGTTGATGHADQVVLSRLGEGMEQLGTLTDVAGQGLFPPLAVAPDEMFLFQAFAGGVHTNRVVRGGDLLTGPVELTVYETTADPAGVRLSNLNLVVRRLRDTLEIGYLLTVENAAQPPRAIVPTRTGAFALSLPGGTASVVRMQINSGLMPIDVSPATGSAPDEVAFDRTLLPGRSRIDITARLPYPGALDLPLRASADLAALTIFAFPTDLQITGSGLSADGVEPQTGFLVFRGAPLPRGQTLDLRIGGGDPEAALAAPHGGTGGGDASGAESRLRVVEQRPRAAGYAPWIVLGIVVALGLVAASRASRAQQVSDASG